MRRISSLNKCFLVFALFAYLAYFVSPLNNNLAYAQPFERADCASCERCGFDHKTLSDAEIEYCRNLCHEVQYCSPEYIDWQKRWAANFWDDVKRDFSTYFLNPDNILTLSGAFLIAGIFANTNLDQDFQTFWINNISQGTPNQIVKNSKFWGDIGFYYLPVFFGAMYLGHLKEDSTCGNIVYQWGYRGIRTTILAGVQQLFFTNALGSGRPKNVSTSKWTPFKYNTGVSGHATYGAIPFIVAAQMTDPFFLKAFLYIASTLPGLSRINSSDHYFSQVFLGWSFAYLSANAVYNSDLKRVPTFMIGFTPVQNGGKIYACLQF